MPTALEKYKVADRELQTVEIWVQDEGDMNAGEWKEVPRLRCEQLKRTVQPYSGISSAVFTYDYGDLDDGAGYAIKGPLGSDDSELHALFGKAVGTALSLHHKFLRVTITKETGGAIVNQWVGCVISTADRDFKQPRSPATDGDSVVSYGTQEIEAAGPEWLLNRTQIRSSATWIHTNNPGFEDQIAPRGLPFNIRKGRTSTGGISAPFDQGNKKTSAPLRFTTDLLAANQSAPWSGNDIVDYLQQQHFPDTLQTEEVAPFTSPQFQWQTAGTEVLDAVFPQIDAHGQTLFQVINECANPRRYTHWAIKYQAGLDQATDFGDWVLEFGTATDQAINLPSGKTIPANGNTIELNTSGTIDGRIALTGDASQRVDQVIVQGARRGFVFSSKIGALGDFSKGWSSQDETRIIDGGQGIAGWGAKLYVEREQINRQIRSQQYQHVFTRFVFDTNLSTPLEKTGLGISEYMAGLRISRSLPLLKGWDYSTPAPTAPIITEDQRPEYRDCFAVYRYIDVAYAVKWSFADKLADVPTEETAEAQRFSSVQMRPLADAFGFELKPSGKPPWWQAKAVTLNEPDLDITAQFDYENDIQATVYYQSDQYVEGVWPAVTNDARNANTYVIRLGDVAFYDTLMRDTVVDVVEGNLVTSPSTDVILRDDRDILSDIAQLAFEWFGETRFAYSLRYAQLLDDVHPGHIATSIDGATVANGGAVITEVIYDFGTRQTNIATSYAEPDIAALASEALGVGR